MLALGDCSIRHVEDYTQMMIDAHTSHVETRDIGAQTDPLRNQLVNNNHSILSDIHDMVSYLEMHNHNTDPSYSIKLQHYSKALRYYCNKLDTNCNLRERVTSLMSKLLS